MNSETNPAVTPPRTRLTRRQLLTRGLAAAGTCIAAKSEYETNTLTVTRHTLRLPGLKSPCRLAQVSDLHRSWCVSEGFITNVVTATNALKPDLVALTGDFVTRHSDYIGSCVMELKRLRAPLGLFAVLGNHDYKADNFKGAPAVVEGLEHINVRILTNRSERLDNNLRLVGVDDFREGKPDPDAAFRNTETGEAVLALTHSPFMFSAMCRYDCVTLAGHTHGGQINLPVITDAAMPGRMRYQHGWYREPSGPGRLYVSRGLGVVGAPFRLFAPPEIAVFDLMPD